MRARPVIGRSGPGAYGGGQLARTRDAGVCSARSVAILRMAGAVADPLRPQVAPPHAFLRRGEHQAVAEQVISPNPAAPGLIGPIDHRMELAGHSFADRETAHLR